MHALENWQFEKKKLSRKIGFALETNLFHWTKQFLMTLFLHIWPIFFKSLFASIVFDFRTEPFILIELALNIGFHWKKSHLFMLSLSSNVTVKPCRSQEGQRCLKAYFIVIYDQMIRSSLRADAFQINRGNCQHNSAFVALQCDSVGCQLNRCVFVCSCKRVVLDWIDTCMNSDKTWQNCIRLEWKYTTWYALGNANNKTEWTKRKKNGSRDSKCCHCSIVR